jgi:hypothetical protein
MLVSDKPHVDVGHTSHVGMLVTPHLTGLLEDLHRLADGQPPAGTTLTPGVPPYLPYAATVLGSEAQVGSSCQRLP